MMGHFPWTQEHPEEEQVLGQASADLDLGPDLKCFLQELAIMQEEGGESNLSQGTLAEDYEDWIMWRGQSQNT